MIEKCDEREKIDCSEDDKLEDMIYDVEDLFMNRLHLMQSLKDDIKKSLHISFSKFTKLYVVLRLYNLKEGNR